jgi:hypothetical protein
MNDERLLESAERAARNEPSPELALWAQGYEEGVASVRGRIDRDSKISAIPVAVRGRIDEKGWARDDDGPWELTLDFRKVNQRFECVGYRLSSVDRRTPVTTTVQRQVPLGEIVRTERRNLADAISGAEDPDHPGEPRIRMSPTARARLADEVPALL